MSLASRTADSAADRSPAQARSERRASAADSLASSWLPGYGSGGADSALVAELKRRFATVKHAKPPASRKGSVEWFVVAQGFKG